MSIFSNSFNDPLKQVTCKNPKLNCDQEHFQNLKTKFPRQSFRSQILVDRVEEEEIELPFNFFFLSITRPRVVLKHLIASGAEHNEFAYIQYFVSPHLHLLLVAPAIPPAAEPSSSSHAEQLQEGIPTRFLLDPMWFEKTSS